MAGARRTTAGTPASPAAGISDPDFRAFRTIAKQAHNPPMGWNSWDVFGVNVTEAEVHAQAAVMAERLLPAGYDHLVIDLGWYAPGATAVGEQYKRPEPDQLIDAWGRLIPDPARFPSSIDDQGFAPLARHLHSRKLKLGIHVMRGIPIQAVHANTPIFGSDQRARDIVKYEDRCVFYDGMYAIDMNRPGAMAYYQSVLALYAEWGIDFIKADDMTSWPQHYDEVLAFRWALDHCGRPMTLSLSPGACGYMERSFVNHAADMFRITGDLWDSWDALKATFAACRSWKGHTGPGRWADCDMIPLGLINVRGEAGHGERRDRFTPAERRTLMTLWAIFRSPLMIGSDLTRLDAETESLLTHPELLRLNQDSTGNNEVSHGPGHSIWWARSKAGDVHWMAVFNLLDQVQVIEVDLRADGGPSNRRIDEIWSGRHVATNAGKLPLELGAHAVELLRLSAP